MSEPFEDLIAVFDQILVSDNPAVMAALQNLMLLVALSNTKKDGVGPISELFKTIKELKQEVDSLRTEVRIMRGTKQPQPNYPGYPNQPWPNTPGIGPGSPGWDDFMKWGARSYNTSNSTGSMTVTSSMDNEDKLKEIARMRAKVKPAYPVTKDRYQSILERMREKMAKK